ncbi:LOW QUALITY PROTEIN: probable inactive receptor-like protein kinase At3g56050 [Salvia splendens]|uniref:LOW QUALITY PROTEIN: probable inactive receptor-like protein kinase At3g56050 n=1 Tax=Salvia splendens TaxID=180675 RepID=UPI001C25DDDC|nr:LOW QUALITY PROTEIN: probable inactive receptor-like protein kinase At3g56050 [Salvia splendens]
MVKLRRLAISSESNCGNWDFEVKDGVFVASVTAVVKREQIWQLCHQNSSFSSIASDFTDVTLSFSSLRSVSSPSPQHPLLINDFIIQGVRKLKRSELEAACEDFTNVIGSASNCTLYKGTLLRGVEIAVTSVAMSSEKDWSSNLESQFRKRIDSLSKVNHKNFVSLLGFCEEQAPFTRMMVFEYAPNGTLFEHIHIKEAEHLDWTTRLRIAMGIAYCLEHMHQLTPPLAHKSLTSSCICLTEDYAAKVSDIAFWDEGAAAAERQTDPQSNVYSFGVILFEMITGRLPYTAGSDTLEDWASDYLRRTQPLREMVDPTLGTYWEDQVEEIGEVIRWCADERPSMKEVCTRLRVITGIGPDEAVPKLSPLWWEELEILSTEAN